MVVLNILDVHVDFPLKSDDVENNYVYMEKVIDCLKNNSNGVLESLNQNERILCLLCSSFAYLEHCKTQFQESTKSRGKCFYLNSQSHACSKLIYSTRTLDQVTRVFNKYLCDRYKNLKIAIVGSRDQLCLNPKVKNKLDNTFNLNLCKAKVNSKSCQFFNNVNSRLIAKNSILIDMEDLVQLGKKNQCCPYYLAQSLVQDADVIFTTYNYLLDSKNSEFLSHNIEGNIVIFDEAHNIKEIFEQCASTELHSIDIKMAIKEVAYIEEEMAFSAFKNNSQKFGDRLINITIDVFDLNHVKSMLCKLVEQLNNQILDCDKVVSLSAKEMLQLMSNSGITQDNSEHILSIMERMLSYLSFKTTLVLKIGESLQKCVDMILILFQRNDAQELLLLNNFASYKILLSDSIVKRNHENQCRTLVLNVWCFDPTIKLKMLLVKKPKSIIFAGSDTSPIKPFISQMQIPIHVTFKNSHIIQKSHLYMGIVTKGPNKIVFNTSYRTLNRVKLEYFLSLGESIVNLTRAIPGGILVFFPCTSFMLKCLHLWRQNGVWLHLDSLKRIFVESDEDNTHRLIEDYYETVGHPGSRGAIMMAVFRGKIYEEIDLTDDNGRGVILIGLSFRPYDDLKVTEKMAYVRLQLNSGDLKGREDDRYYQEVCIAINQLIGRVINHKDDYAIMLLCDERFAHLNVQHRLAPWTRQIITCHLMFDSVIPDLTKFIQSIQTSFGTVDLESKFDSRPTLKMININDSRSTAKFHNHIDAKTASHSKSSCPVIKFDSKSSQQTPAQFEEEKKNTVDNSCRENGVCVAIETITKIPQVQTSQTIKLAADSENANFEKIRLKKVQTSELVVSEKAIRKDYHTNNHSSADYFTKLLRELKQLLSDEQYKILGVAIKVYFKNGDVQQFANTLKSVCTSETICKRLLEISCVIPKRSREEFNKILKTIVEKLLPIVHVTSDCSCEIVLTKRWFSSNEQIVTFFLFLHC